MNLTETHYYNGQEAYEEDVRRSKQTDRPTWEQLTLQQQEQWNSRPQPRTWGDYWEPDGTKKWGVVGVPEYFG